MYRPVESPCFLERGIPIGMIFIAQDAVHQAQMIESMTIDNEPFGFNIVPDVNVSDVTISNTPFSVPVVMLEQTLDAAAPFLVSQQVNVNRQTFKGGIFKLGIKIKGWEMPGGWKSYCADKGIRGLAAHAG
jgi:hypothetical protein